MVTLKELEEQAMQLTERQRAFLAAQLLESLPAMLHDEDFVAPEAAEEMPIQIPIETNRF